VTRIHTYWKYLSLPSLVFIILGGFGDYFSQPTPELESAIPELRERLTEIEQDFYVLADTPGLVRSLVANTFDQELYKRLAEKDYSILVYQNQQLVYWNKNDINLAPHEIEKYPVGINFDEMKNGFYQVIRIPFESSIQNNSSINAFAFYNLRRDFFIENKYLENAYNADINLSEQIQLHAFEKRNSTAVWPDNPERNLYVSVDKDNAQSSSSGFSIVQIAGLFCLLLFLWFVFVVGLKNLNPWLSVGLFGAVLLLLRFWILKYNMPIDFSGSSFFNLEGVNEVWPFSIGGTFLTICMTLFWLAAAESLFRPIKNYEKTYYLEKFMRFITVLLLCFILLFIFSSVVQLIFEDERMNLLFYDLFLANKQTYLGILSLLLLTVAAYIVGRRLFKYASILDLNLKGRVQAFVLLLIPVVVLFSFETFDARFFFCVCALFFFAMGATYYKEKFDAHLGFRTLFSWLLVISFCSGLFFHLLGKERKLIVREQLAEQVSTTKDEVTEFRFEEISNVIVDDAVIKRYFTHPYLPLNEMTERVKEKYFDDYFAKYDIRVYPYFKQGQPVKSMRLPDYTEFESKIMKAPRTENKYLFLIPNLDGNYNYVAKLPIFNKRLMGFLIIELRQTATQQSLVYPELVIEDKYRQPAFQEDYSYAIYDDGSLKNSKGNYKYSFIISDDFANSYDGQLLQQNGYDHFFRRYNGDKVVVISDNHEGVVKLLSLFSYIFLLLFIFSLVLFAIAGLFNWGRGTYGLRQLLLSSLTKKINAAMVATLFISFLVIGLVTIAFFSQRSSDNHFQRLDRRTASVLGGIESVIENYDNKNSLLYNREQLEAQVTTLSEIHAIDMNVYSLEGHLIASSQPFIFEKGLVGNQINSEAYNKLYRLGERKFIQNEKVGNLSYLSAYAPIADELGKTVAYLSVPYFARDKDLRQEISNFLITIVNVYALILLIATLLSILISNYVTRSLGMISERLKEIRLGQRNEKLDWPDDDEIGDLVNQYNQTIEELDKSARLLAQSERKMAWESMARQVAHEIKNPLTPMKLSIQHLQRAQRENHPRVKDLTERVSRTLIEQIDHLSTIASEFSDFAKMPETQEEMMDINHSLRSVTDLYMDSEVIDIVQEIPAEQYIVYADRNQMNRLFHNLVKNGKQAIPDERRGRIQAKVYLEGTNVIAEVTDNGKGISDDEKDKVFVPSFTTKSSGMGLGLAISKNIIENLGGEIYFETIPGEGTSFYIKLKLQEIKDKDT